MAIVEDARDAEDMVRSLYPLVGPELHDLETHKQGYTWIVRYTTFTVLDGVTEHEVHINAQTGRMLRIQ